MVASECKGAASESEKAALDSEKIVTDCEAVVWDSETLVSTSFSYCRTRQGVLSSLIKAAALPCEKKFSSALKEAKKLSGQR